MEKARMTRHIENSFNDIGLEELRRSVYDYTSYYYQTTYPDRDTTIFCRENMLSPFDNISDKVTTIINTLKLYWHGLDKGFNEILDIVKKESLLGQAIYLIARNNVDNNDVEMTFNVDLQEIPVVFGDLMILYMQSGYDVRNLKEFLVELYDEYYPKVYTSEKDQSSKEVNIYPHITEEDLDIDIRNNLFEFLDDLVLAYKKDLILSRYLYRCPDQDYMRDAIDKYKNLWMRGVRDSTTDQFLRCDDNSKSAAIYYPIIDASFIFRMPKQKNKEFESLMYEQLEGITSGVVRDCNHLFPDRDDFKDTITDSFHWRTALLKKTDTIMIDLSIHHSDCINIPDESGGEEESINGSVVCLRISIVGK